MKQNLYSFLAFLIRIICMLLVCLPASAETFHLKNGKKVQGELVRESEKHYIVKTTQGFMTALLKAHVEKAPEGALTPAPDANAIPPTLPPDVKPSKEPEPYLFLMQKRRFAELEQRLGALESSRLPDADGSDAFYEVIDRLGERILQKRNLYLRDLDAWCKASPENYLPFLVRGNFNIDFGWEARGGGYADTVSDQAFKYFAERLNSAKIDLERAMRLNPHSAAAPTSLIAWAMAFGDNAQAQNYFEKAIEIDPDYLAAYERRLQSLKEKWGGSHELMFSFARLSRESRRSSPAFGLLVIDAHIEMAGRSGNPEDYWSSEDVWEEVSGIYQELIAADPTSTRHRNAFARLAYSTHHYREAAEQFSLIGEEFDKRVWSYKEFKQARDFVLETAKKSELSPITPEEEAALLARIRDKAALFGSRVRDTTRLVEGEILFYDEKNPALSTPFKLSQSIKIQTRGKQARVDAFLRVPDEIEDRVPEEAKITRLIYDGERSVHDMWKGKKVLDDKEALLYGMESNPWNFITERSKIVGTETVFGIPCRIVESAGVRLWIDPETDRVSQIDDGKTRCRYMDFKPAGPAEGFLVPYHMKVYRKDGRLGAVMSVQTIEYNLGIDESVFTEPVA